MRTKLFLFAILTPLAVCSARPAHAQTGGTPIKLMGSSQVVVDNSSSWIQKVTAAYRTTFYTFTVQIVQSTTPTTVYFSDLTSALRIPAYVVIEAGQTSKSFIICGVFAPSNDTLTAYNSIGSTDMAVQTVNP